MYASLIRSVLEVHTEVKRKTAAYGVAAVLLALLLSVVCYNFVVVKEPTSPGQPDTGLSVPENSPAYATPDTMANNPIQYFIPAPLEYH